MKDFYIGYVPTPPQGIARLLRIAAAALLLAAVVSATTVSVLQNPFAASRFEYGHPGMFAGRVQASPYPTLVVARPGTPSSSSRYLLVGEGKHGADALVASYDGQMVHLEGVLIYRGGHTLIEVLPGSIKPVAGVDPAPSASIDLGQFALVGEIVDSKCYFGVMNPGSGKVHQDCAVRCLSGGIPASFAVPDFEGSEASFLLTDITGKALGKRVFRDLVARPVRIRGSASKIGDTLRLAVAPDGITPAP